MNTLSPQGTSTKLGRMNETPEVKGLPRLTTAHRELLDEILDKWSLQVLDALCEQPHRFNELRRAIPEVTQKSLTAALRRLERNGMIERVVLGARPIAVEYRITALGTTLQDLIDDLWRWSTVTLPDIETARARFDRDAAQAAPGS